MYELYEPTSTQIILACEQNRAQKVPQHTLDALNRYLEHGIPPGGFLTAVLSNDLMQAFAKADDINITNMYAIVGHIYNNVPMNAHGSPEIVENWIKNFKQQTGVRQWHT